MHQLWTDKLQITMIGTEFVSLYHVTATHNLAIPLAIRAPVVGVSNALFVVAHTLGLEWEVDNSGPVVQRVFFKLYGMVEEVGV